MRSRLQLQGALVTINGLLWFVELQQGIAEIVQGFDIIWTKYQRVPVVFNCRFKELLLG